MTKLQGILSDLNECCRFTPRLEKELSLFSSKMNEERISDIEELKYVN